MALAWSTLRGDARTGDKPQMKFRNSQCYDVLLRGDGVSAFLQAKPNDNFMIIGYILCSLLQK
jgi:hypothetical protein